MRIKCKQIFLTGATGFVGRSLLDQLIENGLSLSVSVRKKTNLLPKAVKQFVVTDLTTDINWQDNLKGVDCIIHLAGKAHVIDSKKASVLDEFRKINTQVTLNLAKEAINAGVKRFVFVSSIRVNGNATNVPFTENDTPNPQEPYAISKFEAEQGLFEIAKETGLEVVIIRPPLVYGPNAPGNFGRLIQWANNKRPMPLPLGSVNNSRSLIALDNLVDFIITCSMHPKAANKVFLISDGQDLSTTKLLKKIAHAFGSNPFLLPIPTSWMGFTAKFVGRKADTIRLFSSLQVDSSKARKLLDWQPKVSIEQQLEKIANETSH